MVTYLVPQDTPCVYLVMATSSLQALHELPDARHCQAVDYVKPSFLESTIPDAFNTPRCLEIVD